MCVCWTKVEHAETDSTDHTNSLLMHMMADAVPAQPSKDPGAEAETISNVFLCFVSFCF